MQTVHKRFISADELLLDSYRLAKQVHDSGYRPDFLIGVWRGGAPVGIAVQEYLAYMGNPTDHIAIRTSSYMAGEIVQEKIVKVYGLNYVIENVREGTNLLIVDDVFDSGRSMAAILQKIRESVPAEVVYNTRIACVYYKPSRNAMGVDSNGVPLLKTDYHVYDSDEWLVFPHELVGLSREEIIQTKPEGTGELF